MNDVVKTQSLSSTYYIGYEKVWAIISLQEIMENFLLPTPTETPEHPALPRVSAAIVPDKHPTDNKTPTDRWSQIIGDRSSNPYNFRYALATHVITEIKGTIHYEANAVTIPIKSTSE